MGKSNPRENQEVESGFSVFWQAYPKRRARIDALRAWRRLNPSDDDLYVILEAIGRYVRSGEWADPQYIPYPATFLNGRRWEDEIAGELKVGQGPEIVRPLDIAPEWTCPDCGQTTPNSRAAATQHSYVCKARKVAS